MDVTKGIGTPVEGKQPETPVEPEKKRKTSIFRDPYVKVE